MRRPGFRRAFELEFRLRERGGRPESRRRLLRQEGERDGKREMVGTDRCREWFVWRWICVRWKVGRSESWKKKREGERGQYRRSQGSRESRRRTNTLTSFPSVSWTSNLTIRGGFRGKRERTLDPNSAERRGCWTTERVYFLEEAKEQKPKGSAEF